MIGEKIGGMVRTRSARADKTSRIFWHACLTISISLAGLGLTATTSAQDNSVFNRVRQLPDLGACPKSGPADPDLKQALSRALVEARKQAENLVALAQQAKAAGIISADKIKEISDSAQSMDQALQNTDDCLAARTFAGATPIPVPADGTCEHSAPPCIYQPHETDTWIKGRLSFAGGSKVPAGATASVNLGGTPIKIDLQGADKNRYDPDSGIFNLTVSPLNSYNTVELVQTGSDDKQFPSTALHVAESVTCEKSAGRRPCLSSPHAGDTQVSGEVAVKDKTLPPNTQIAVKVNGVAAGNPVVAKQDGDKFAFTKTGLDPLAVNTTVQVDQTPAVADSSNTTGPVRVERAQGKRDQIGLSTDTLDFGHQAVQTASESKSVTVTNNTGASLTFEFLTSRERPRDFQISGCQDQVDNSKSCTFNVVFAPFPSSRIKPSERYLAVVPSSIRQEFETLRDKLNREEHRADREEDNWRRDKRCADNHFRDEDCRDDLGLNALTSCQNGTEDDSGSVTKKAEDNEENRAKAQHIASMQWSCYAQKRDESAQVEQTLRSEFNVITLRAVPDHWKFPFTRGVVGIDMSAPTSRTIKQAYFVDFDLLAPLKFPGIKKNEDPLENRFWLWLNPRITSLPQAADLSAVSTINESGSFFDPVKNGKLDKIANGLDVNGGLEFALVKPRDGIPWWAEYVNTQARLSPSFIIGVGMSTPFSTDTADVKSSVTQSICDAFKAPSGQQYSGPNGLVCTFPSGQSAPSILVNPTNDPNNGLRSFISFYQQDRSRFFRRYYAGLRLKTYFFSPDVHSYCQPFEPRHGDEGDCAAPYDIFPGILDITVGRDEAVTGGRLTGWLLRLEGVYPLPWYQGIHAFGSMYTKLSQHRPLVPPFSGYTIQDQSVASATDLNTFRFALQPLDRDYFRIGVGVDLFQVFKKTGQPNKNAPQAPSNGQTSPK